LPISLYDIVMNYTFPIWLVAIDYILACLMIILVLKFLLNLFFSEEGNFVIFRFTSKLVSPIINNTKKITPAFIVQPLVPLYIAWIIFMIRIYFLPLCLGYSYVGKFSFIFEKDLFFKIKSMILGIALDLNYGI